MLHCDAFNYCNTFAARVLSLSLESRLVAKDASLPSPYPRERPAGRQATSARLSLLGVWRRELKGKEGRHDQHLPFGPTDVQLESRNVYEREKG
jgi:hypothetical protein